MINGVNKIEVDYPDGSVLQFPNGNYYQIGTEYTVNGKIRLMLTLEDRYAGSQPCCNQISGLYDNLTPINITLSENGTVVATLPLTNITTEVINQLYNGTALPSVSQTIPPELFYFVTDPIDFTVYPTGASFTAAFDTTTIYAADAKPVTPLTINVDNTITQQPVQPNVNVVDTATESWEPAWTLSANGSNPHFMGGELDSNDNNNDQSSLYPWTTIVLYGRMYQGSTWTWTTTDPTVLIMSNPLPNVCFLQATTPGVKKITATITVGNQVVAEDFYFPISAPAPAIGIYDYFTNYYPTTIHCDPLSTPTGYTTTGTIDSGSQRCCATFGYLSFTNLVNGNRSNRYITESPVNPSINYMSNASFNLAYTVTASEPVKVLVNGFDYAYDYAGDNDTDSLDTATSSFNQLSWTQTNNVYLPGTNTVEFVENSLNSFEVVALTSNTVTYTLNITVQFQSGIYATSGPNPTVNSISEFLAQNYNDGTQTYPGLTCEWTFVNKTGSLAATFIHNGSDIWTNSFQWLVTNSCSVQWSGVGTGDIVLTMTHPVYGTTVYSELITVLAT